MKLMVQISATLSVLFSNSSALAKRLLEPDLERNPGEPPQTVRLDFATPGVNPGSHRRVNLVHSIPEIDYQIREIQIRLTSMKIDLCIVIAMWLMVPDEPIRILYWTTHGLIIDLVALAVDLEFESRIQVVPAASKEAKARIRCESENTVLDRHKVELMAMLERVERVRIFEVLRSSL